MIHLSKRPQNDPVLVDLSLFPSIKNQGNIPMCASVAIADLFVFHYSRLFKNKCFVDCLRLHNQICADSHILPSARLSGALALWKRGLIGAKNTDQLDVSNALKLKMTREIESTDPSFTSVIQREISLNNPVILDMPLMISAMESLSTGQFPSPYSIENDKKISRHIVLIVGYREAIGDNGGIWIVRNCWGAEWGTKGMGSVPIALPDPREKLKATIVEVSI